MKVFKNSAIYTIGYIFSRLQNFIFLPVLTRALAPDDVGIIESVTAFAFFLTIAIVFNLDACISSNFNELKEKKERDELFWTALTSSVTLAVISILFIWGFHDSVLDLLSLKNVADVHTLFLLALLSTAFSALSHICHVLMRLRFQSMQYSLLLGVNTSLNLGISYFLVTLYRNPLSIIVGGLSANLITFAATLFFLRDIFPVKVHFKKWAKKFATIALPLLPYSLFAWALSMADRSILAHFRELNEVGFYSVLSKIAALTGIILGPFQIAWMPFAMKAWSEEKQGVFSIAYSWLCLGISLLILALGFISKPLVLILAGPNYTAIAPFIVPMSICNVLNILFYFPLVSFMHKKKMYASSIAFGIGAIGNIVTNLILIPKIGLPGAVIANISSYILMYVTAIIFEKRQTNVGYAYLRSGLLFLTTVFLYMMNDRLTFNYGLIVGLIFFGLSSIILIFLARFMRLIDFKVLKDLLKSLKTS